MGEVVVISEGGGMELEVRETDTIAVAVAVADAETEKKVKEDGSAPSVVRWEKFLPRMVLRVLLVEADDSTRQIITALLRKCSYRVAAVADGLKAWEVLKGRSHDIDLILTEVDLPSISGFALLTLIMEHDICKNIPVIMMSSHDSVSTVYKCMLRGAADFLVKPVRKNELRNLWQHVWRRQASGAGGLGPQDESVAQQKVEATAENNAASSNHSSGYMACIQRNRDCIEKGSDAQSSSTKPDLEVERECLEYIQNPTEPIGSKSLADEIKIQKQEENVQKSHADKDANTVTEGEDMQPGSQRGEHPNLIIEACDNNQALSNSFMEAIDLIGAFDNYPRCIYRSSGAYNGMNHIDSSPLLDLSLRRSHPSSSVNQVIEERPTLHHSDASAFSRYVNRVLQPPLTTAASVCNQQTHNLTTTDKQFSNPISYCVSDTHGPTVSTQKNILSLPTGQAEISIPSPQQKVFPISIPGRDLRFENLCATYGSVMAPSQSPGSATHQEPPFWVINPFHHSNPETKTIPQQNPNNSSNQTEPKRWHKLDCLEDQGRLFSPPEHSGSSSFGKVNPVPIVRGAVESGNEGNVIHDGNSYWSLQREVALTKFRLKRKDRCYEKKVRYESRKKLAEQRPRVKGQFVRHQHTDSPPLETDNCCGNSVDG